MSSPELHFKIMAFQHVSKSLVKQQDTLLPRLNRVNNRFHGRQRLHLHFNKKRAERRHGPLAVRHNRSLSQALNQSSGATNDNVPLSQTLSSEEERPASPRPALWEWTARPPPLNWVYGLAEVAHFKVAVFWTAPLPGLVLHLPPR